MFVGNEGGGLDFLCTREGIGCEQLEEWIGRAGRLALETW